MLAQSATDRKAELDELSERFNVAVENSGRNSAEIAETAKLYLQKADIFLRDPSIKLAEKVNIGAIANQIYDEWTQNFPHRNSRPEARTHYLNSLLEYSVICARALSFAASENIASIDYYTDLAIHLDNLVTDYKDNDTPFAAYFDTKNVNEDIMQTWLNLLFNVKTASSKAEFDAAKESVHKELADLAERLSKLPSDSDTRHYYQLFINLSEELLTLRLKKSFADIWNRVKATEYYKTIEARLASMPTEDAGQTTHSDADTMSSTSASSGSLALSTAPVSDSTNAGGASSKPALAAAYRIASQNENKFRLSASHEPRWPRRQVKPRSFFNPGSASYTAGAKRNRTEAGANAALAEDYGAIDQNPYSTGVLAHAKKSAKVHMSETLARVTVDETEAKAARDSFLAELNTGSIHLSSAASSSSTSTAGGNADTLQSRIKRSLTKEDQRLVKSATPQQTPASAAAGNAAQKALAKMRKDVSTSSSATVSIRSEPTHMTRLTSSRSAAASFDTSILNPSGRLPYPLMFCIPLSHSLTNPHSAWALSIPPMQQSNIPTNFPHAAPAVSLHTRAQARFLFYHGMGLLPGFLQHPFATNQSSPPPSAAASLFESAHGASASLFGESTLRPSADSRQNQPGLTSDHTPGGQ